jgi:hypothetical protein
MAKLQRPQTQEGQGSKLNDAVGIVDWKRKRIARLDHAEEGQWERPDLAGAQRYWGGTLGMIRYSG